MKGKSLVKRGLLAAAFVTAMAFMTLGSASDAEARGCRGYRGGGGFYHSSFYAPPVRSYYAAPRAVYYGGSPWGYGYRGGGGFYYGGRNVAVGIGW